MRIDSPLRIAIESGRPHSAILYGPPGTGKTTLARIVAESARGAFEEESAVNAGRAEVRAVIERAEERRRATNRPTIFFLDEIHRFNKAQQDALLPAVEEGLLTLIGATTENPYFEVNSALLSRAQIYELQALGPAGDRGLDPPGARRSRAWDRRPARDLRRRRDAAGDPLGRRRADRARGPGAGRRDRPRGGRAGRARNGRGRPSAQGRAVRPRGRSALRLHLGLDQGHAGLGPRCLPLLPGGDARGRRGPSLPGAPDGDPGLRGRRQRRPHGARGRERRRPGGRPRRPPGVPAEPRAGGRVPGAGAEVERLAPGPGRGRGPRARVRRPAAARLPARLALPGGGGARPRRGLRLLTRRARRGGGDSRSCPRRSRARGSTAPPIAAGRPRCRGGWRRSGRASAAARAPSRRAAQPPGPTAASPRTPAGRSCGRRGARGRSGRRGPGAARRPRGRTRRR